MPQSGTSTSPSDATSRAKVIRLYAAHAEAARATFERIADLACAVLNAPSAVLSFATGDAHSAGVSVGLDGDVALGPLAAAVIEARKVTVVPDLAADGRWAGHALTKRDVEIRFFAGAPLVAPNGQAIGTLAVLDVEPRQMGTKEKRHLASLAAVAMDELALRFERARNEKLSEAARENRQRFRSVVEQSGDWVWETDAAGVIRYSSPGVQHVLGRSPEEILGQPFDAFLIPSERAALRQNKTLQAQIANGEAYTLKLTFRHSTGAAVIAEVSGRPITASDGKLRGFRSLAHDVTATERSEEALALALERAERMAEAKTRFLSTVSHEMITPLTVIEMQSKMLLEQSTHLEGDKREQLTESVRFIEESLGQIRELVNGVQHAHRLEADTSSLHIEAIEPLAFLQELTTEFKSGVGMNHTFRVGGQRFEIQTDQRLLRMVIGNLITNAIKYAPAESPIEVTVVEEDGEAHFRVRDHGIGIPEDALPRLFEPFFRAGNVGDVYGTGLGLSIVRQCVERLDGRFSVQSKPDAGSLFHIYIPLVPGQEA